MNEKALLGILAIGLLFLIGIGSILFGFCCRKIFLKPQPPPSFQQEQEEELIKSQTSISSHADR